MAWEPPTMADEAGIDPDAMVPCERCGRRRYPDQIQRTPPSAVASLGWPDWTCGACRGRLRRRHGFTRSEIVRHLGPPAHVTRKLDEADAYWEARRRDVSGTGRP